MNPIRYSTGSRVLRVDPDDLNTIQEVDDNPRAYKNRPAKGRIPGFGERYDTCGQEDPHFCGDCGRPITDSSGDLIGIGRTCWRKDCPRCAPGWAMRRAYQITSKIEDYRIHKSTKRGGHSPKFHHVTLIPPYKDGETTFATNTSDPLDSAYQIAKTILEDLLGVFGGVLVYHPFSGDSGDDRGEWKRRLFKQRDWEGDVRDELHYRAHFHALVVADSVDYSACEWVYDKTGWVTHRIEKQDSNVSLYDVHDLASATTYSLSHAGVGDEISDSYRYFGEIAQHTASDDVFERCKEAVRDVAPSTLDVDLGSISCGRPLPADSDTAQNVRDYVPSGTATGTATDGGSSSTDDDSEDAGPECTGRLVPLEHADSFLADVEFDAALEDAKERWEQVEGD